MSRCFYPGQRFQIDVKFVPSSCLIGDTQGKHFYQYTAIDECSRDRYLEVFEEHSTLFISHILEKHSQFLNFPIECIQTDNGSEFTNRVSSSKRDLLALFEATAASLRHKLIRPYTPRHNGKVERSHREDHKHFYSKRTFYSFADFQRQLKGQSIPFQQHPYAPARLAFVNRILCFHTLQYI